MDRGAWQATAHRVAKVSDTTEVTWHTFMDSPAADAHTQSGLCFQCVGSITGCLPAAEGLLPSAATSGLPLSCLGTHGKR